jgi:hypothetical protein
MRYTANLLFMRYTASEYSFGILKLFFCCLDSIKLKVFVKVIMQNLVALVTFLVKTSYTWQLLGNWDDQCLPNSSSVIIWNVDRLYMYCSITIVFLWLVFIIVSSSYSQSAHWISLSTLWVSSTNKIDHHDRAEILLKVELNTITLTLKVQETKNNVKSLHSSKKVVFVSPTYYESGWKRNILLLWWQKCFETMSN